MIRSLKRKFIILSTTSLFILLALIISGMNLINYQTVVSESDDLLVLLTQNKGHFPEFKDDKKDRFPLGMSPETPYESRYFSVLLNADGNIIHTDTGKIASVDSETAIEYASAVIDSGKERGFMGNYRYIHHREAGMSRIIFLDCGRRLDSYYDFLFASICMALTGFIAVSIIIAILSGKIIRPIAESYEKQKRFITDAGHELKTPLTVINANVDLLELNHGNEESITDIRHQTDRLRSLTNDLVMLAKMEETETTLPMIDFPISEIAADTLHPYQAIAARQKKKFSYSIRPMLTLNGNAKNIERLISILMDNAFKYSPEGGSVSMELTSSGKNIIINVFNTTVSEITREHLEHVFDRFYRTDASRSSENGGYGIGLSIAKAIVLSHGGKINAWTKDGRSFGITVSLPM